MAARALAEALHEMDPSCAISVEDPLARSIPIIPRLANWALGISSRRGGRFYQRQWESGRSPFVKAVSQLRLLSGGLPASPHTAVIATHVFALRMALAARRRGAAYHWIYGVVTDFGLHGFWPLEGVDGYFVAHEDLAQELVRRGLDAQRVHVTGIPLRKGFIPVDAWQPPRSAGALRVVIMAGGVHSGAYTGSLDWLQEMIGQVGVSRDLVRFTVVAGSRADLQAAVDRWAGSAPYYVSTRGVVNDIPALYRSHDLILAKPGGLTVAETLACGIPLACMRAGPGQETANVAFLERHGLLMQGKQPAQAAQIIRDAISHPASLFEWKQKARTLGKPDAARATAAHILSEVQ